MARLRFRSCLQTKVRFRETKGGTKSNPGYAVNEEFNNIFYKDHPKGRFNLGKEDIVRNANSTSLKRFHARGFNPNNMDLVIVGGLPENIEDLVEKYFDSIPKGENTRKKFPELPSLQKNMVIHRYAPERNNIDNPEESSAHINLSYVVVPEDHIDASALKIVSHILGFGANSFLFQNMGLKKGLAYRADAGYDGFYNAGEMTIIVAVPAKRIEYAVDAIFEELEKIKAQEIDNKIIDRVKKTTKFGLAKASESNEAYVLSIEYKLDYGLTQDDIFDRYNSVTPERIKEVAKKYFPDRENGEYVLYIRDPLKK
ncbi:insulinase family protein [Candidatus Woesearchaeota archaeon]|nr:insulinase family protein [Candidatus Woesearchaeota archaeon]